MIEIFAPIYYKKFKCIADKCSHSCCVGWQIDVDEKTLEGYESLSASKRLELLSHMEEEEGVTHIRLCDDGSCPFLDERGLCRIISSIGESFISEICREHPRFYNRTARGIELGLGLVCEEACRIVLTDDDFGVFEKVSEREEDNAFIGYDALPHRDFLLSILSNRELSYEEKLSQIEGAYSVSSGIKSLSEWQVVINTLEFMNDENRHLFLSLTEKNSNATRYIERFLAYLITRYVTESESYDNLRARLGFCLLGAHLMKCAEVKSEAGIFEFARIFSEEIEYSEDNVAALIFEFECSI